MELEKITERSRRYDDACGTAHGLELLGERWALLVVRELILGPKRFGDIRRDLPGISANVLTQRLETLEAHGILRRRRLPPPASVQVYELTEWGYEVEPVIVTLGRWAARSPGHDPTLPLSATSLMMSFRTMFRAERATADVTLAFWFGDDLFVARVKDGFLTTRRGEAERPDAIIATKPEAVAAAVYSGAPLPEASIADGDRESFGRFAAMFELPPKAG